MAAKLCPDEKHLRQLLEGALPAAKHAEVSAHLEECFPCRKALDVLAAGSSAWLLEAGKACADPELASPELRRAVRNLGQSADPERTQPHPPLSEELAFLDPPHHAGHLGRIDHYEILQVVGRGGFGIVFKAFDESLHRVVAIKVMAPQLAASAVARQRFQREAKAAAAVTHDNVVTIHHIHEVKGLPYFVMPFVPGGSLQERLAQSGPLELNEVLRIGRQTAAGLAAAHQEGVIHRDVKPANILLENGVERVKLTDFGLARAADDSALSSTGVAVGTPQYMSPEQARGDTLDHRSDLFSLGSVLYAMCAGHPPFRGSTILGVLRRVSDSEPEPLQELNSDVPDWLVDVIAKLHAKDPADRYQSAKEVEQLLAHNLAEVQRPKRGRPKPPPPPAPKSAPAGKPTVLPYAAKKEVADPKPRKRTRLGFVWRIAKVFFFVVGIITSLAFVSETGVGRIAAVAFAFFLVGGLIYLTFRGIRGTYRFVRARPRLVKGTLFGLAMILAVGLFVIPISVTISEARRRHPGPVRYGPVVVHTSQADVRSGQFGIASGPKPTTLRTDGKPVTTFAYTTDGKNMAVGDEGGSVRLFQLRGPAWVQLIALGGHADAVECVAFSPDGNTLATGSRDRLVRLWTRDGNTWRSGQPLVHGQDVQSVAFSPDGRKLVSAGGGLKVWDPKTGDQLLQADGQNHGLRYLTFFGDGKTLASLGDDGIVAFWDTATWDVRQSLHSDLPNARTISVDVRGQTLAVGGDSNPDGRSVRLWKREDGVWREPKSFEGPADKVMALALSPDGKTLVTGGWDTPAQVWDTASGQMRAELPGHRGRDLTMRFDPEGKTIGAGSADGSVRLWKTSAVLGTNRSR